LYVIVFLHFDSGTEPLLTSSEEETLINNSVTPRPDTILGNASSEGETRSSSSSYLNIVSTIISPNLLVTQHSNETADFFYQRYETTDGGNIDYNLETTTSPTVSAALSNVSLSQLFPSSVSEKWSLNGEEFSETLFRNFCANGTDMNLFSQVFLASIKNENNDSSIDDNSARNKNDVRENSDQISSNIFTTEENTLDREGKKAVPILCQLRISEFVLALINSTANTSITMAKDRDKTTNELSSMNTPSAVILTENNQKATETIFFDSSHGTSKREAKNTILADFSATSPFVNVINGERNNVQIQQQFPASEVPDTDLQSIPLVPEDLLDDFDIFNQLLNMIGSGNFKKRESN
jgi:hypothetical protein